MRCKSQIKITTEHGTPKQTFGDIKTGSYFYMIDSTGLQQRDSRLFRKGIYDGEMVRVPVEGDCVVHTTYANVPVLLVDVSIVATILYQQLE